MKCGAWQPVAASGAHRRQALAEHGGICSARRNGGALSLISHNGMPLHLLLFSWRRKGAETKPAAHRLGAR